MKNLTLTLLLCFVQLSLLTGCGPKKGHVRIKGEFKNLNTAEFYLFQEENAQRIDTVRIQGGKFSHDFPIEETCVMTMLYPNYSRTYVVAEPGKTITLHASAEHLQEAEVSGTDENERFTKFRLSQIGRPEGDLRLAAQQYIRDNAKRADAVAAFISVFASQEAPPRAETLAMLDVLRKGRPKDRTVISLERRLRPLLKASPGSMLSSVEVPLADGRVERLHALRDGRPMLVTFFASWTQNHEALRTLRRIRRAYPAERLATLSISLDLSGEQCNRIVERDSIPAPVAFDGKAFESPLAQVLGARYVPSFILIDRTGKVVARDMEADKLEQEINKLF